jgi:hypothetical protein
MCNFHRHFWLSDHSFLQKGQRNLLGQVKELAELLVLHPNNKKTFLF